MVTVRAVVYEKYHNMGHSSPQAAASSTCEYRHHEIFDWGAIPPCISDDLRRDDAEISALSIDDKKNDRWQARDSTPVVFRYGFPLFLWPVVMLTEDLIGMVDTKRTTSRRSSENKRKIMA